MLVQAKQDSKFVDSNFYRSSYIFDDRKQRKN